MAAKESVDTVREAHAIDWILQPGVVVVATMQDEKDNYFVAVGVLALGCVDYQIPTEVDGVQIKIVDWKKVTASAGATDMVHAIS